MPVTTTEKNRAEQMQFLRFIAFFLIFLWHCTAWRPAKLPCGEGAGFAVSFFLILSGALTAYSSFYTDTEFSLESSKNRVSRKLRKIYPLYLVTTIYAVSYSNIPQLIANGDYKSTLPELLQFLKNLLLIQSWFPKGFFSFNGVGWFLSTIMLCYVLENPILSIATKIKINSKSPVPGFILVFFGAFISTILYCYFLRNTNAEYTMYVFPFSRIGEFVAGICIGYIVRLSSEKIKPDKRTCLFFSVLEVAVLVLWFGTMFIQPKTMWITRSVQCFMQSSLLVLVFLYGKGYISKVFSLRPFVALGDISFECFLLHQIIIFEYETHSTVGTLSRVGSLFSILFCLFLTILIAQLVRKNKVK